MQGAVIMAEKKYIIDNADLMQEWDWEQNSRHNIDPYGKTSGMNIGVWWICKNRHSWEDTINHRSAGRNCPYCSNHRLLVGFNDLASQNPLLASEWHPTKNNALTPQNVFANSNKKVWWKCSFGHEWEATISSRNRGNGCPICKKELQTSFPEQAIFFYLRQVFPDTISRYVENGNELDIFVPSIEIGVEYDGKYFHTERTIGKEQAKDAYFSSRNILVIRIKEISENTEDVLVKDNTLFYSPAKRYKHLGKAITVLIDFIFNYLKRESRPLDISLEKDSGLIYQLYLSTLKEHSVLNNDTLAQEWNYQKNNGLNPQYIPVNSGKKVWWKCKSGHEWQAVVASRNSGNNCPYCSNQKLLLGYNDLATQHPNVAAEWHPTKNGTITPHDVLSGASKKYWWICKNGHEWQALASSRVRGIGCPYCTGQKVSVGENDLESQKPHLAQEWHPTKNGFLTPSMVTCGSGQKVWWRCEKGHEWQAYIKHRVKGSSCPHCYKEGPKITTNKRINVYNASDLSYYDTFADAKALCQHLGLDYQKQFGNIASACKRRQKTLLRKYVLRYADDDEFSTK